MPSYFIYRLLSLPTLLLLFRISFQCVPSYLIGFSPSVTDFTASVSESSTPFIFQVRFGKLMASKYQLCPRQPSWSTSSMRRLREIMSMVTSVSMSMQSRFGTFRGSLLPITKYFLQSSVPRPQSEPTSKNEEAKVWWDAQDPNLAIAENPSMLHGFDPSVMSSRPVRPSPYSQGLRKRAVPYR